MATLTFASIKLPTNLAKPKLEGRSASSKPAAYAASVEKRRTLFAVAVDVQFSAGPARRIVSIIIRSHSGLPARVPTESEMKTVWRQFGHGKFSVLEPQDPHQRDLIEKVES